MVGASDGIGEGSAVGLTVGDPVGKTVGKAVGKSVGDADGLVDGSSVGVNDGLAVGKLVGKSVGCGEGNELGAADGSPVGRCVGRAEGFCVGDSVGSAIGSLVGVLVGFRVGCALGLMLGRAVGTSVGSKLGFSEGLGVGFVVGIVVGLVDGFSVGESVVGFAIVGAPLHSTNSCFEKVVVPESDKYETTSAGSREFVHKTTAPVPPNTVVDKTAAIALQFSSETANTGSWSTVFGEVLRPSGEFRHSTAPSPSRSAYPQSTSALFKASIGALQLGVHESKHSSRVRNRIPFRSCMNTALTSISARGGGVDVEGSGKKPS